MKQEENTVFERWCAPEVERASCESGAVTRSTTPGATWHELGAYREITRGPEVFGLHFATGYIPRRGGWGLIFRYESGGRQLAPQELVITFLRLEDDEVLETLSLGSRYEIPLGGEPLEVRSPGLPAVNRVAEARAIDAELELLLTSPVSMRDAVWARLDELRDRAEQRMAERRSARCPAPPDAGAELARHCPASSPTPEDERMLEETISELSRRRELIDDHRTHLFTLLSENVPEEIL